MRPPIQFDRIKCKRLPKQSVLDRFKCSDPYFEEYLKFHAYDEDAKQLSKTWGFMYGKEMIGHIAIAMSHMKQEMHETLKMDAHGNVPAVLIGYLATHRDYERMGIGSYMVGWAIVRARKHSKDWGQASDAQPQYGRRGLLRKVGLYTCTVQRTGQRTGRHVF